MASATTDSRRTRPLFAPWKLTTEDPDLAKVVREQFKEIGVWDQLCNIDVVKGKALEIAHTAFDSLWKGFKSQIGITGIVAVALTTPHSIRLYDFRQKTTTTHLRNDSDDEDSIETIKAIGHVQRLSSSHPISVKMDPYDQGQNMMNEVQNI